MCIKIRIIEKETLKKLSITNFSKLMGADVQKNEYCSCNSQITIKIYVLTFVQHQASLKSI